MANENPNAPLVDKATGIELQKPEDIAKAVKAEEFVAKPVSAGQYKVAEHTTVRSLHLTFRAGEDFTGDLADIPGLVAAKALVEA